LPSSLTTVLRSPLVFLLPPELVWGTGTVQSQRLFGAIGSVTSAFESARLGVSAFMGPDYLSCYTLTPDNHRLVHLPSCVPHCLPPRVGRSSEDKPLAHGLWYGADTVVLEYQPVVHRYALPASLSSRLTLEVSLPQNLAFGGGFLTPLSLLCQEFSLDASPRRFPPPLSTPTSDAPLPRTPLLRTSATRLWTEPRYIVAQDHSDQ